MLNEPKRQIHENADVPRFSQHRDTIVSVEFVLEKENIYTLDTKGELLITIMSSLAQEESRNISLNTTWGQRKRFADGKINLP